MNFGKIEIGIGAALAVLGTLFALQGVGLVGGSSLMDGNSIFIYIGSLLSVCGLVLIAFGLRPPTPKPKADEAQTRSDLPAAP
jgi:hypothetical protein